MQVINCARHILRIVVIDLDLDAVASGVRRTGVSGGPELTQGLADVNATVAFWRNPELQAKIEIGVFLLGENVARSRLRAIEAPDDCAVAHRRAPGQDGSASWRTYRTRVKAIQF